MVWSPNPQEPERIPRAGWYATPPDIERPSWSEWYDPLQERHGDDGGVGTLTATVKQIERVTVGFGGSGELLPGAWSATAYVAAPFSNEDSSQTGELTVGLSAWGFVVRAVTAALSGLGITTIVASDSIDGLAARSAFPQYQPGLAESSIGTLIGAIVQKYAIDVAFSGDGLFDAVYVDEYITGDGLSATAFQESDVLDAASSIGQLAGALYQIYTRTWAFAGSGSLSATAYAKSPSAPSFAGVGSLAPVLVMQMLRALTLSNTGTLAATTTQNYVTNVTLTGVGTLTGSAVQAYTMSAQLTGTGALAGGVTQKYAVAAGFNSSGNFIPEYYPGTDGLWAIVVAQYARTDAQSGTGTLSGAVYAKMATPGALTGSGSLTATARMYQATAAPINHATDPSYEVNGNSTAYARTGTKSRLQIGNGSYNAHSFTDNFPVTEGEQLYNEVWVYGDPTNVQTTGGAGGVALYWVLFRYNGDGSTTVTAYPGAAITADTTLNGIWTKLSFTTTVPAGVTYARAFVQLNPNVTVGDKYYYDDPAAWPLTLLDGNGAFTVTRVPQMATGVTLTGTGALTSTSVGQYVRAAALTGAGALTSTSRMYQIASAAALSGAGVLSAARTPQYVRPAALAGDGSITAAARMYLLNIAAALSSSGALSGAAVQQYARSAALTGTGALAGTAYSSYARSAALTGTGALSGAARMYELHIVGALSGPGTLSATRTSQYYGVRTAALSGGGSLTATAVAQYVADFVELAEGGDYENTAVPIYSWGGITWGDYSTEQAYSGTHSWKFSTPGGTWNGPFLRQAATSPFSPGRRIDLRVKIKPHASNNTSAGYVLVAARFWTDEARTAYIDSTWVTIANSALSAGWQTLENLGIIAPAGTLSVEMWVLLSSDTPAGNAYYVDDVSVRIPPLLISDGALSGAARMFQTASAATLAGSGSLSATATGTLSAVTVNAVGTGNRTTGSSTSMTVTGTCNAATSGTTTWAVVGVVMSTSNARNGSCDCTYGGVAMTKVGFASWGTSGTIHIFALQNPATGSQNVTATDSTSTPNYTAMALQTVVYDGASSVTGFTSAASLSITTATVPTSAWAFATHINGASISAVNQTERYRTGSSVSGTGDYIAVQDAAGAGSTITFTASGTATTPGSAYVVISP